MARTLLTPINAPTPYATAGVAITFTAGDAVNGNAYRSTGREFVLARNTDGTNPQTVTIHSEPDPFGREGDITAYSIPANGFAIFGPLPVEGWQQSDGNVWIDVSNALVQLAVIRLP